MSCTTGEANVLHAAVFVDELERRGVRHVVLCPGSRSTPQAVAFAFHPGIRTWVLVDERSAGYFALGMARELDAPIVLLCTSGTAAANLAPAVIEARLSRIPLVVVTADRPPELRGWGAPQTIDQLRLYGENVKWFAEMPVPTGDCSLLRQTRAVAARASATSRAEPAGPVHLNAPFREPLLPDDFNPLSQLLEWYSRDRTTDAPLCDARPQPVIDGQALGQLTDIIARQPRGVVVCGPGERPGLADAVAKFAATTGYPILADPLSGVRFGPHNRSAVVDTYDAFLRDGTVSEDLAPEFVIHIGAFPTSKPLQQVLARQAGKPYVLIDPGDPRDPQHLASDHLRTDPVMTLRALADRLAHHHEVSDLSWHDRWLAIDRATRRAIQEALASEPDPFEGAALADVAAALPDGATLVVGNSMPVRDADAFVRGDARQIRIVGNRGANGIDGVISSALGAAATGAPTVLVVGDLSFYHDLNGLLASRLFDLNCTIVILNNNGGGIFSFLPQAGLLDPRTFEALFGTPARLDVSAASRLYGAKFSRPGDRESFRCAIRRALASNGLSIVEYVTRRDRNVTQHRAVWTAVSIAVHGSYVASH